MTEQQANDLRELCTKHDVDFDRISASGDLLQALTIIEQVLAIRAAMGLHIYQNQSLPA